MKNGNDLELGASKGGKEERLSKDGYRKMKGKLQM